MVLINKWRCRQSVWLKFAVFKLTFPYLIHKVKNVKWKILFHYLEEMQSAIQARTRAS